MSEDDLPDLPKIDIKITSSEVRAVPRKLNVKWMMDGDAPPKKTPLKKWVDAIDDPTYDPEKPPLDDDSPESGLIAAMAGEMSREIDAEILKEKAAKKPAAKKPDTGCGGGCNAE